MYEPILNIIETNKDRIFIIDSLNDKTFTYSQFHYLSLQISIKLRNLNIRKGDRIIAFLPNCVEFVALYFACLYSGFIIIPINTNLNIRDIEYIIKSSKAKVFIYSETTKGYIEEIFEKNYALETICFLLGFEKNRGMEPEGKWDIEALYEKRPAGVGIFEDMFTDDIFTIMYTSGTTQFPKGVAHNMRSMIHNATSFIKELEISSEDRFYNVLSIAYMGGFYNLIVLPLLAGASVVIGEAFSAQTGLNFWQIPIRYKVNTLWLVPTILSILLKLDRGDEGVEYCKKNIKQVFVGTAPLPVKLRKEFEKRYHVKLIDEYGLSETLFVTTNTHKAAIIDGTVGKPLPGCLVAIVDSDGKKLPFNKEGEIVVHTEDLMLGYINSESGLVDRVIRDQWFYTGDVGYLTRDSELFITGRKKDLIIRGGINISPRAIEDVLTEHEAIEQAAVVGVPHIIYGEDGAAIVKLKKGYEFDKIKLSLIEHCKRNLSPVQQPCMFLEIEEFPYSSTGKIDKKKLKEMLSEKLKIPMSYR